MKVSTDYGTVYFNRREALAADDPSPGGNRMYCFSATQFSANDIPVSVWVHAKSAHACKLAIAEVICGKDPKPLSRRETDQQMRLEFQQVLGESNEANGSDEGDAPAVPSGKPSV